MIKSPQYYSYISKQRIQETVFEARSSGGDKLKYCSKGVGNDASCNLQVPIESTTFAMVNPADMEKQLLEVPYNAVKLHLFNVTNLTKAFEIAEKAKKLNLPLILDTSSLFHKSQPATIDDFEADFAVGVGAYQFYGNGLNDTAYNNKLNRLLEINRENDSLPYVGAKFRTGPQI
jgi:enolase